MIITHEWVDTLDTRYSEKRSNGELVHSNYFPSMYDYESINDSNIDIVKNTHVVVAGSSVLYRLYQPPNTTWVRYRFLFRTTEDRLDMIGSGVGGYLFSFGGLENMRGRAITEPSDGEWHEHDFVGRANPDSETTTIAFRTSGISSPVYEIKNFEVTYGNLVDYDYFTGDTPDYSTNPPLVYHDGEWIEYVPKLYI